jgi:RNA methyltransferase, TrmH family
VPITSAHNPTIKFIRSLARASARRHQGLYLAEGVRLITEAFETGQSAPLVLYERSSLARTEPGASLLHALPAWADRAIEVEPHVLASAAQTEAPSGVLAVLRLPQPPALSNNLGRFGLLLDTLADPGNAGTILRTAAAFGVNYVVALPGTADLFAPKVVRAGMGAHFRLPIYTSPSTEEIFAQLQDVTVVAAAAGEGRPAGRMSWPERTALLMGSEAAGLSRTVRPFVNDYVHIPMAPGVESLNVAVATAILLFAALGPDLEDAERYR